MGPSGDTQDRSPHTHRDTEGEGGGRKGGGGYHITILSVTGMGHLMGPSGDTQKRAPHTYTLADSEREMWERKGGRSVVSGMAVLCFLFFVGFSKLFDGFSEISRFC